MLTFSGLAHRGADYGPFAGFASISPDAAQGQSCASGGSTRFIITGALSTGTADPFVAFEGSDWQTESNETCVPEVSPSAAAPEAAEAPRGTCRVEFGGVLRNFIGVTLFRYEVDFAFSYADGTVTRVTPNPPTAFGVTTWFWFWRPGAGDTATVPALPAESVPLVFQGQFEYSPFAVPLRQYNPRLLVTLKGDGTWDRAATPGG